MDSDPEAGKTLVDGPPKNRSSAENPPSVDDKVPEGLPKDPGVSITCVNAGSKTIVKNLHEYDDMDLTDPISKEQIERIRKLRQTPLKTDNTFTLENMIGEGGFGEVWSGEQKSLGREIAIKRLKTELYQDFEKDTITVRFYEESFLREAIATARLEHPNIVPCYDFAIDDQGRPLLAMKYVRGKPWQELIKADRPKELSEFLDTHIPILIDVAQAVAFAHSKGMMHRDLKPSQVMVGEFGEVLLMDWGLALVWDEDIAPCHGVEDLGIQKLACRESSGNPAGTIAFMAPEQTPDHGNDLGPWTDIYLLGGVLYYLLSGYPPHPSPDSSAAFLHAKMGFVEEPEKLVRDKSLPKDLVELCMKCMEAEIDERLPSAQDFIEGLENYLSEASKRNESRKIIESVTNKSSTEISDYSHMGVSVTQIERASALWPDNPDVIPLRQKILAQYTKTALKNKDLRMARIQAEQMEDSQEKNRLIFQVSLQERRSRMQALSLRVFFVLTIIALIGVSSLSIRFFDSQVDALQAQEVTEQFAFETLQTQRRAEDLVYFLIDDVSGELETLYRLDILDEVAAEAMNYYEETRTSDEYFTTSQLEKRARLFELIGNIRSNQGRLQAAKEAYENSREIRTKLYTSNPMTPKYILDAARIEYLYASTLIQSHEVIDGNAAIKKSHEILQAVFDEEIEVSNRQKSEAKIIDADLTSLLASMEFFQGNISKAVEHQTNAIKLLDELDQISLERRLVVRKLMVEGYLRTSNFWLMKGDVPKAFDQLKNAVAEFQSILRNYPPDASLEHLEVQIQLMTAEINIAMGLVTEASSALDQAEILSTQLNLRDSMNIIWRESIVSITNNRARLLQLRNENEKALTNASTGLGVIQNMVALEPGNIRFRTLLAGQYNLTASLLRELDTPIASAMDFSNSTEILNDLLDENYDFLFWEYQRAKVMLDRAMLDYEQGKMDSALENARMAVQLSESMILRGAEYDELRILQADALLLEASLIDQQNKQYNQLITKAESLVTNNKDLRMQHFDNVRIRKRIHELRNETDDVKTLQEELDRRLNL